MKRAIDFTTALIALPFAIFIILVLVVLIRATSAGPALFRQIRVGRNEQQFTLVKLRTMEIDTGDLPSHEADRAKITAIGHFLRRTKLDELPQLFNVFTGSMALVGPRPCLPSQTQLRDARRDLGVFALRPGVTGLAQIEGIDMSTPEKLAHRDADYLRAMSARTDLAILLRTFAGGGRGDAVG